MARTPGWRPSSPVSGSTSSRANPTAKHRPLRTCVACRQEAGKAQLIRIVRTPVGTVVVDRQGRQPGRGAYLHASVECLEAARKRGAVERALRVRVPEGVWLEVSNSPGPA